MSEYIPLEIQEEILKRLPLKPLIQFRSVSKPWKSLIDSPDFIVSYGVRHPQPDDRFILRYLEPPSEDKNSTFVDKYVSFVDNDDDHSFVLQEFIPSVPDLIKTLKPHSYVVGISHGLRSVNGYFEEYSDVVGSSHGLLCVNGYFEEYSDDDIFSYKVTEMVILWNPSISKSVGIEVPYMVVNENFSTHGYVNKIGFGVCPVTFDPTVLMIKYLDYSDYKRKMKDMPGISIPWKVQVFTLSTGTWSILSTNLPRESIRLRRSPVVINRFIYWLAYDILDAEDGRSSDYLIMSFDLTAKEFKEINFTDSLTNRPSGINFISKLRESLVLLEYHTEFEEYFSICCCLWMMKDQGDSRSFTKLYTINLPDVEITQILGFRKTGELIIVTRGEERYAEVQIYDPIYEYADNLGIDGEEFFFFMCSYMETLLLLDQSDGYIYSNSM